VLWGCGLIDQRIGLHVVRLNRKGASSDPSDRVNVIDLGDVRQRAQAAVRRGQAMTSALNSYPLSYKIYFVSAGVIIGTVLATGAVPAAYNALFKGSKR
jgi:hypothetical protein